MFRAARPRLAPDCSVNADRDATVLPRFTYAKIAGIAFKPAPASNFSADWVSTIGSGGMPTVWCAVGTYPHGHERHDRADPGPGAP